MEARVVKECANSASPYASRFVPDHRSSSGAIACGSAHRDCARPCAAHKPSVQSVLAWISRLKSKRRFSTGLAGWAPAWVTLNPCHQRPGPYIDTRQEIDTLATRHNPCWRTSPGHRHAGRGDCIPPPLSRCIQMPQHPPEAISACRWSGVGRHRNRIEGLGRRSWEVHSRPVGTWPPAIGRTERIDQTTPAPDPRLGQDSREQPVGRTPLLLP